MVIEIFTYLGFYCEMNRDMCDVVTTKQVVRWVGGNSTHTALSEKTLIHQCC